MNRDDRRPRKANLDVQSLEGRAVLSMAGVGMFASPVGADLVQGISYLFVQGTAKGSVQHAVSNPDTGSTLIVLGSAQLKGIGPALLTGKLQGTGFIARGNLGGEITLSDSLGNVTLKLDGPSVPGYSAPRSGFYHFSVEKGTGAYAHDIGNGTARLSLGSKTFRIVFRGLPNVY